MEVASPEPSAPRAARRPRHARHSQATPGTRTAQRSCDSSFHDFEMRGQQCRRSDVLRRLAPLPPSGWSSDAVCAPNYRDAPRREARFEPAPHTVCGVQGLQVSVGGFIWDQLIQRHGGFRSTKKLVLYREFIHALDLISAIHLIHDTSDRTILASLHSIEPRLEPTCLARTKRLPDSDSR